MQELVDDSGELVVKPEAQYAPGQQDAASSTYFVLFNQVYVSKPTATEKDGTTSNMFPHEARLRNMTYASPMYVDISCVEQKHASPLYQGCLAELEIHGDWYPCVVTKLSDGYATVTYEVVGPLLNTDDQVQVVEEHHVEVLTRLRLANGGASTHRIDSPKEFLGYVPIMLRSRFCVLADKSDKELCELGECIYDQGGYFVINGSEKVVVAQERMSNNHVYCFRKKQPHKSVCRVKRAPICCNVRYSWVVECRSHVEHGARPTSTIYMQMYNKAGRGQTHGNQIRVTLPYVRVDVPVIVVFRALGEWTIPNLGSMLPPCACSPPQVL